MTGRRGRYYSSKSWLIRPVAGLLAAAILPAAAVAGTATAAGAAPAAAGVAGAAARPAPRVPVLRWRACHGEFQCATARVPLDYRRPHGRTISIAVVRHRATAAHRNGVLFVNTGGPSEQLEQFLGGFDAIPAALRARFDIVSLDPRGFGFSTALRCFPTAAAESKLLGALPPFPVGARQDATWERVYARLDTRCAREGGGLLDHDTTADVARDLNLLREALGARRLNFLGLSYGTGLGATYANLFPGRVGHMVLDGNLNPVAWTSGGRLPSGLRRRSDLATAATMRSYLNLCGQAPVSACAFSAGSPAATRAKWHTLLGRLLARPVTVGSQTFTYADAVTSVPLGDVNQWQGAAPLLQQLWLASSGKGQGGKTAARPGRAAQAPGVYLGVEQTDGVICADTADPRGAAAYASAARLADARAGGLGLYWAWSEEVCANWPRQAGQDRYTGPWNRRTASPILVIGLTGDPVTSYQSAVATAHDLARARLLTVDGFGHTEFFNPSTCANRDEIRYLTTGLLPPRGAVCRQNGQPFPPPSGERTGARRAG